MIWLYDRSLNRLGCVVLGRKVCKTIRFFSCSFFVSFFVLRLFRFWYFRFSSLFYNFFPWWFCALLYIVVLFKFFFCVSMFTFVFRFDSLSWYCMQNSVPLSNRIFSLYSILFLLLQFDSHLTSWVNWLTPPSWIYYSFYVSSLTLNYALPYFI